jgi:hypothetical protein
LTGFPVPQRRGTPPHYRSNKAVTTGLSKEVFLGGQDRLTPVQVLFTGKPTPHRSSAFSGRIIATTTKICTRKPLHAGSRHALRRGPCALLRCSGFNYQKAGGPSVIRLSIVHFRGWCIRQVSCYTLLSRFQLPWPRPCCLDAPTPFLGSDEHMLRCLRSTFGASRVANSAYQKWPTQKPDSCRNLKEEGRAPRPFRV